MSKSVLTVNIIVIGLITLILIFSIFYILYFHWGESKFIQDSLSTTGSIFSAVATLGAAGVAAYLFNDWKDEHNKIIESNSASELINLIIQIKVQLRLMNILLEDSEEDNQMINIEISKIIDNFKNNNQFFQEKMEFFNLLIKKEFKKYENFLNECESLVDSFGKIVKLTVTTDKRFSENRSKFIPLINNYQNNCDDFCNYLVKFVKAK
ncbi:hypothetical protein [Acinetobacter soli]|uniref:hypothetical protein n=1 Tax=Acinetobacter soli TaxID=487316 RepID=UPI000B4DE1FE|nr:hypothetical protein [Acinetobacter soli]